MTARSRPSATDAPVRLALVGLGDIAWSAHLPALLRSDSVDLVALAEPDADRLRRGGEAVGPDVHLAADLGAVLEAGAGAPAVDGVVLATPPWVTTTLASQALRAGVYVLAEKPIATSLAAAEPLAGLGPDLLGRLQVGLTYRHDPALERLRWWIRDGPLDGPLLLRAHIYDERLDPADRAHERRLRTTLDHGPPVVHEGAHVFDWLAYLLDAPPAVADAWAVRTDPTFGTPNLVGARLTYPGGTTALCEFGWLTASLPRCELSVLGQRGHAVLDGFTFRLRLDTGDGARTVEFPGSRTERCFDRQLDRFVDLVRGRAERAVPGWSEGIAALRLSEQIAAGVDTYETKRWS